MRSRGFSQATGHPIRPRSLVVVQAFRHSENGNLVPASEPREYADERRAIARAEELRRQYAGVVAWKRDARPDEADLGEPTVIFVVGEVPDLDMPIRQIEELEERSIPSAPREGSDIGEPTWMGMQLPTASAWQPFCKAFHALYRMQQNPDLFAVYTALENRRIVVLPPEAAKLVQRELPAYSLRACGRPPSSMVCLELGHRLQIDTTWFAISDDERARRRGEASDACRQVLGST